MLLGFIIEDITGKSYRSVLNSNIIDTLKLNNTDVVASIDTSKNQAQSFYFLKGDWQVHREASSSNITAAAGIISTPNDLNIFIKSLLNGELVSDVSLTKIYGSDVDYAKGIRMIKPFENADYYAYGHDGNIDGFHSIVAYYPEQDTSIAFIANGVAVDIYDLRYGIFSIYFNQPYAQGKITNVF